MNARQYQTYRPPVQGRLATITMLLALGMLAGCPGRSDDDMVENPADDDADDDAVNDDDSADDDDDSSDDDSSDDDSSDDDWPPFALGVEYAELGLAAPYAAAGVTWTKTRLEAFSWGPTEPAPPVEGVHTYDWSCTDAYILEYQSDGLTNIMSYMTPRSEWGSVDATALGDTDIAPSPDHMDDYRAWVRALFERYDGDGVDDMPGLLAPVRYWVLGGEWTGFWPSDDHDSYLEFAAATGEEARAVYPEVRLGTIPLLMWEVFEGNEPTDELIAERLAGEPLMHNSFEGIQAILDHPEHFDFVSVHSLGDYTEVRPTLRWFDEQMDQRGYSHPVWFDDAFPMGGLANYWGFPAMYPVTGDQQDAIWDALEAIARFEEPANSEALPWLRRLAAAGTVKKVVTALAEGAVGIQIGNTEDWVPDDDIAIRHSFAGFIGAPAFLGMLDVVHDAGEGTCDVRTAGATRPAYRNLELLAEKLGDGTFDYITFFGSLEGVRGYRFENPGHSMWVLWNEDGVLELPGEVEETVPYTLVLPCTVAEVTVTHAVTDMAAPEPEVEVVDGLECSVHLELDSVPVFVEIQP